MHRAAFRLAYKVLGDTAEAEDIAQESLARALVRWRKVEPYAVAWVSPVAVNLALDRTRHSGRRSLLALAEQGRSDPDAADRLDLQCALRDLPRRQRDVVVLRYLLDHSEQTVAAALGVSVGSVKTHASRGLAALRLVREAVRHRASRLRWRRRAALGGSGTAVALAAVPIAVSVSAGPARTSMLVTDDPTPAATATATQEPTSLVTEEPTPTPTPSVPTPDPPPSPGLDAAPSPSPSPTCSQPDPRFCPDGKPGWSASNLSCHDATAADLPDAAPVLFDGVTASYVLSKPSWPTGWIVPGQVVLTSSRTNRVGFDVTMGTRVGAVIFGDKAGGSVTEDNPVQVHHVDLPAGETTGFAVDLQLTSCGDFQSGKALPAGDYQAGGGFSFSGAVVLGDPAVGPSGAPSADPSATPSPSPPPREGTFAVRTPVTVTPQ